VTYSYWKFLTNYAWVHICVKCRSQPAPLVNCSLYTSPIFIKVTKSKEPKLKAQCSITVLEPTFRADSVSGADDREPSSCWIKISDEKVWVKNWCQKWFTKLRARNLTQFWFTPRRAHKIKIPLTNMWLYNFKKVPIEYSIVSRRC